MVQSSLNEFIELRGNGTKLAQALRGFLGRLCTIDGHCRRSESLFGCNGACDHKGH